MPPSHRSQEDRFLRNQVATCPPATVKWQNSKKSLNCQKQEQPPDAFHGYNTQYKYTCSLDNKCLHLGDLKGEVPNHF